MRFQSIFNRAAVFVATVGTASMCGATAQRTFVASTGSDTNPCTITQPCRGFAAAIANTSNRGEVIVLESAGYGQVTITKSVAIVAPPGVYAGISVASGDGVVINGAGISVRLRGLTINSPGGTPNDGIRFINGADLVVEDCEIIGMGVTGIEATACGSTVSIKNTALRDNVQFGFRALGTVSATLDGVTSRKSATGIFVSGGRTTIVDSVISENGIGAFAEAFGSPGLTSSIAAARSVIDGNTTALQVFGVIGTSASVESDANVMNFNTTVFKFNGVGLGEAIYTRSNNSAAYYTTLIAGLGSLTPVGPI